MAIACDTEVPVPTGYFTKTNTMTLFGHMPADLLTQGLRSATGHWHSFSRISNVAARYPARRTRAWLAPEVHVPLRAPGAE